MGNLSDNPESVSEPSRCEPAPRPWRSAPSYLQQRLGGCEILRPVSIEKGVDRAIGELHRSQSMARGPLIDLAGPALDHCPAQILSELHWPQPENRVGATARGRAGEIAALPLDALNEPRDEIGGEERRISRDADDERAVGTIRRRPIALPPAKSSIGRVVRATC